MFGAEEGGDGFLFDVGEVLFEGVGEVEGDDGETGVVVGAGFDFFAEGDVFGIAHYVFAFWTVDVAYAGVPACCFERFAEETRVGKTVFHYGAVAIEAKVDEVEVLGYDLGAGAGEVESIGFFGAAEVVEFKD